MDNPFFERRKSRTPQKNHTGNIQNLHAETAAKKCALKTKNTCFENRYFSAEINADYFLEDFLLVVDFAELDFADDLEEVFLQEQAELEFEQELLP